jgi:hypothetical protein
MIRIPAAPSFTVQANGNQGFDVFADGVLVAPIRLAANGALVADQIETNASGVRLSGLRAVDAQAVSFAADDFVSITLAAGGGTNLSAAYEPMVQFKLTVQSFNTNRWLALFPGGPAPFHFLICSITPRPLRTLFHCCWMCTMARRSFRAFGTGIGVISAHWVVIRFQ